MRIGLTLITTVCISLISNAGKAQNTENGQQPIDSMEHENIITGKTTLEELNGISEFWDEYTVHYADCSPNEEILKQLLIHLQTHEIHIIAVIGTWCGDTKEQFPVLQKIIEQIHHHNLTLEYIGVDRDKLAGSEDISSLGIEFVPTFIFYEKGKELGRIVEIPQGTMEENMLAIFNKNKQ
ncbi:MAG: thioredoxin family protein [Bacteroidales bacterium]|jgi:thiol-disulfide isomerase/thioredoxin|nr:thioredoxin family protein [Bacteroidales bacterium]